MAFTEVIFIPFVCHINKDNLYKNVPLQESHPLGFLLLCSVGMFFSQFFEPRDNQSSVLAEKLSRRQCGRVMLKSLELSA